MNIDDKEIEKLGNLARIKLSEKEKKGLGRDIESILSYVSEIQDVYSPTPSRVGAPTSYPDDSVGVKSVGADSSPYNVSTEHSNYSDLINVMREDEEPHKSGIYTEKILKEVPEKEGDYVKVKKIL